MTEAERKEYFLHIKKLLICDRKQKSQFLSELEMNISEYLNEHPSATLDEMISVFGTPEEIAGSFMQNTDILILKRRSGIKKAVIAALVTVVALYAIFIIISLIDVHTEAHGYMKEGILFISAVCREVTAL